jgi:thymidine phosphorylase
MQSYLTDAPVLLTRRRVSGLLVTAIVSALLVTVRAGGAEPTHAGGTADSVSAIMGHHAGEDKIDKLGNETMLSFGYALLKQEPEFTFPLAKNIK